MDPGATAPVSRLAALMIEPIAGVGAATVSVTPRYCGLLADPGAAIWIVPL